MTRNSPALSRGLPRNARPFDAVRAAAVREVDQPFNQML